MIVGTRPQLIKASQLESARKRRDDTFQLEIIDSGQHYDEALASSSSTGLLSRVALNTRPSVGGGVLAEDMMRSIRKKLSELRPLHVVTIGDTNTTLAATIAATDLDIGVSHIEAGLRSGDRSMPEERNRLVADHLSDHLLAPSLTAVANLERENLAERTMFTGDLSFDRMLAITNDSSFVAARPWGSPSVFVTVHRVANLSGPRFDWVVRVIKFLSERSQVVLPVHPRLAASLDARLTDLKNLALVDPFSHVETLAHLASADLVVTDSGGIQREAFWLNRRCATLRDETEWIETLVDGRNTLLRPESWRERLQRCLESTPLGPPPSVFGDGRAAERILDHLEFNLIG